MSNNVIELRAYDDRRRVEILGDLWKMTRKGFTLRLEVRTHPMGWELRAFVGGEMHRSQVAKTEQEVSATSEQWSAEAIAKGWEQVASV